MGLGENVGRPEIVVQFISLMNNFDSRVEMNKKMTHIDLRNGFENIQSIVKERYREFELNKRLE